MKFYVIDDDAVIFLIINRSLLKQSFFPQPETFENAANALQKIKLDYSIDEEFLVLLDINMPGMNGWEFLEELAGFADPRNMFVAVFSSSINERDYRKAAENRFVVKYITKPLTKNALNELEEIILEKRSNKPKKV